MRSRRRPARQFIQIRDRSLIPVDQISYIGLFPKGDGTDADGNTGVLVKILLIGDDEPARFAAKGDLERVLDCMKQLEDGGYIKVIRPRNQ